MSQQEPETSQDPIVEQPVKRPKGAPKGSMEGKRILSVADMKYIDEHAEILTVTHIAKNIQKTVRAIRKYAANKNLVLRERKASSQDERIYKLRTALHKREYFEDIKLQFSPKEIKVFEDLWIKIFIQFDEDVTKTEELQIKKHITLEILKDRFLKKSYSLEVQLGDLQKSLNKEYAKAQQNNSLITNLTNLIAQLQNTQLAIQKEINSLVDKIKDTEKSLKGSRDQRVKEFIDAEKNWTNAIKLLEKPEVRSQIGKHIELMRMAHEHERSKLFGFHAFQNNTVDRLILNSESIETEDSPEDAKLENKIEETNE